MAGSRTMWLFEFVPSQGASVVLQCAAVTIKTSSLPNMRRCWKCLPSNHLTKMFIVCQFCWWSWKHIPSDSSTLFQCEHYYCILCLLHASEIKIAQVQIWWTWRPQFHASFSCNRAGVQKMVSSVVLYRWARNSGQSFKLCFILRQHGKTLLVM
jgi:hypothetical protein